MYSKTAPSIPIEGTQRRSGADALITTSGTAAGDADLDHDELMKYVADQVSPQKKIRQIEEIDEIPKSASGKILRRELRDRDPDAAEA